MAKKPSLILRRARHKAWFTKGEYLRPRRTKEGRLSALSRVRMIQIAGVFDKREIGFIPWWSRLLDNHHSFLSSPWLALSKPGRNLWRLILASQCEGFLFASYIFQNFLISREIDQKLSWDFRSQWLRRTLRFRRKPTFALWDNLSIRKLIILLTVEFRLLSLAKWTLFDFIWIF